MARVRRLSFCGIRNFEEDENAEIRFSRPLSLILGPNGTGKTTIVEALKFALTGDFPPGSDKGKNFIHDPRISSRIMIKGKVKAEIIDNSGNLYTICRFIENSSFETKSKFKTLESTIIRVDKNTKQKTSLTSRCAEIDAEISNALGVSKAMINYVIFCHQEESNWPLDDPKKLKERFDDIFETSRYNKALDWFNKSIKDYEKDHSSHSAQQKLLEDVVREVIYKEEELEKQKNRSKKYDSLLEEIETHLEPIIQQLEQFNKKHEEYSMLKNRLVQLKSKCPIFNDEIDKLKKMIKTPLDGSIEELQNELHNYESGVIEIKSKIQECEMNLQQINNSEKELSDMLTKKMVEIGKLKQQKLDEENKIAFRNNLLNKALNQYGIEILPSGALEGEIKIYQQKLEEKINDMKKEIKIKKDKMDEEEMESEKAVNEHRDKESKLLLEINLYETEIHSIQKDITDIQNYIKDTSLAAEKLNVFEADIRSADNIIDKLTNSLNIDNVKDEIQKNNNIKAKTENDLRELEKEMEKIHKLSTLQTELEQNEVALLSKENEIKKLKAKHTDSLKSLLDVEELPTVSIKRKVNEIEENMRAEVTKIRQNVQEEEKQKTKLQVKLEHLENEKRKKNEELNSMKAKVSVFCNYKDFDETLLLNSKKVKDLQNKNGTVAYRNIAYKEYITDLEKPNPCCPLCHQNFRDNKSVNNLKMEIESKLKNHPKYLKELESELKQYQEKYDSMLQLKPVVEKIHHLEDIELPELEKSILIAKEQIQQKQSFLQDSEFLLALPEKKLSLHKNVYNDIILWDQFEGEVYIMRKTVDDIKSRLAQFGLSKSTMQEIQTQREELQVLLGSTQNDTEELQLKLSVYNEELQHARERRNELKEEYLKIQSQVQKLNEFRNKQNDLRSREITMNSTIDNLKIELVEVKEKLNSTLNKFRQVKEKNRSEQEFNRKKMDEALRFLQEIDKLQNEIDNLSKQNITDNFNYIKQQIEKYENKRDELLSKRKEFELLINKKKEEISNQEVAKRNLTDNIRLHELKIEFENIKNQYIEIKEEIISLNYDEIQTNINNLEEEQRKLNQKQNIIHGKQEEVKFNIQKCSNELQDERYRMARKNYRKKTIEVVSHKLLIEDLKTHSKALDNAMIKFHEERMSTLNRIINSMWKSIYKGNDTQSIQICTQPTGGVGGARRQYNYRLVQVKHNNSVDMRGRCSAGQKVLASIIIRLALAQTFCKNCCVLALDEPTTNLDEENVNSLASALTSIVENRSSQQKNFQLILITHDENFLMKLANLNHSQTYFQLDRKANGFTTIKQCNVHGTISRLPSINTEVGSSEILLSDGDSDAEYDQGDHENQQKSPKQEFLPMNSQMSSSPTKKRSAESEDEKDFAFEEIFGRKKRRKK